MILIIPDNTNILKLHDALYSQGYRLKHIEAETYLLTHTGDRHVPSTAGTHSRQNDRPDHEPAGR